jgi:hypothetical protein
LRHAALQQIEHRITAILTRRANLKVEMATLRAEFMKLVEQREWIVNPTLVPKKPPLEPCPDGRDRARRNAYMRAYMRECRAAGKPIRKNREKYNAYHKEYQRNLRAKQRADRDALKTTQPMETAL